MKYRIETTVQVRVATLIEAKNENEAENIALDRLANGDVDICIHGSESCDGLNDEQFTLTYGEIEDYNNNLEIEEYDSESEE